MNEQQPRRTWQEPELIDMMEFERITHGPYPNRYPDTGKLATGSERIVYYSETYFYGPDTT